MRKLEGSTYHFGNGEITITFTATCEDPHKKGKLSCRKYKQLTNHKWPTNRMQGSLGICEMRQPMNTCWRRTLSGLTKGFAAKLIRADSDAVIPMEELVGEVFRRHLSVEKECCLLRLRSYLTCGRATQLNRTMHCIVQYRRQKVISVFLFLDTFCDLAKCEPCSIEVNIR